MKKIILLGLGIIHISLVNCFQRDIIEDLSTKTVSIPLPLKNGASCDSVFLVFKARLFQLDKFKKSMNRPAQTFLNNELDRLESMIEENPCTLSNGKNLKAVTQKLRRK